MKPAINKETIEKIIEIGKEYKIPLHTAMSDFITLEAQEHNKLVYKLKSTFTDSQQPMLTQTALQKLREKYSPNSTHNEYQREVK